MSDFDIDLLALDEEWVRQPQLRRYYGTLEADASAAYEEARNNRKVVEAEIALDVRRNPGKYGLEKVTEKAVEAMVPTTDEVRQAISDEIEARHAYDLAKASVAAIEHKKKALEKTVELHVTDYYSEPKARGASREQMDEVEKSVSRRKSGVRRRNRSTSGRARGVRKREKDGDT